MTLPIDPPTLIQQIAAQASQRVNTALRELVEQGCDVCGSLVGLVVVWGPTSEVQVLQSQTDDSLTLRITDRVRMRCAAHGGSR